jgi:energy-coupling factor transport system ATP-binding protein
MRSLDGASLTLRAREVVALTGRSGSGKTTLLRLATGLLRPSCGEVIAVGVPVAGRNVAGVCRSVGYLPQDPSALLYVYAESVRDEMRITLDNHGRSNGSAGSLLSALGIGGLADRYPRDLSTGQRQRVALAAVAVTNPPVLLLDEPTRGLDNAAIAGLAKILHDREEARCGVLVATHDRCLVRAAHRELRLEGGRIH